MIYYAQTPGEGAQQLILRYNLRYVEPEEFVSGEILAAQLSLKDPAYLIEAFSIHPDIHAFVLPDITAYFHPDTLLDTLKEGYTRYYSRVIS